MLNLNWIKLKSSDPYTIFFYHIDRQFQKKKQKKNSPYFFNIYLTKFDVRDGVQNFGCKEYMNRSCG